MSRSHPGPACRDLAFPTGFVLEDAGEVALEDYARELARAGAAEAIRDQDRVKGVHFCGLPAAVPAAVVADLEAFARELAAGAAGAGLGWA